MLLISSIVVLLLTIGGFVLIVMADMMSDAPNVQILVWPWFAGGLTLSAALFAAWWFWGGHAVTW